MKRIVFGEKDNPVKLKNTRKVFKKIIPVVLILSFLTAAVLFITWLAAIAGNFPIGNVAHLGGFLAGIAYGYYLKKKYKRKVIMIQRRFR